MPGRAVVTDATSTMRRGKSRAFRLLLAGSSVSMLGSRVTMIAYPMLVLYLTGSPVDAGWVAFAATAPSVLVYIPAGALVDLMDPKRVMLLTETGRGAAILAVVAMVASDMRTIWLFILAAVIEETLEVFSTLAERRYVRALVGQDQAKPAQVRVEARTHVVVLAGRPLGGLLFDLWPIAPFLFDVLTFAASVGALLGIRRRQPIDRSAFAALGMCISPKGQFRRVITRLDQPPEWTIKSDIGDGLRWLSRNRYVGAAMVLLAGTTLIIQALIMIFIAEAHARRLSPVTVGMVLAMSGLGGALGSALAARSSALFENFWLQIQMSVWSLAFILLVVSGGQSPVYLGMTMAILGFTGAMSNIGFDTYLIKYVPETMLARVTSVGRLVSFTACALGPLIGGFLFEFYGAQDGVQNSVSWLAVATIFFAVCSMLAPSMRAQVNQDSNAKEILSRAIGKACSWLIVNGKHLASMGSSCLYAASVVPALTSRMIRLSFGLLIQGDHNQSMAGSFASATPEMYSLESMGPQRAPAELHPHVQAASRL